MIRAVIDTNIIIGAMICRTPSPILALYEAFRKKDFLHVTSIPILEEIEEVLNRDNIVKLHKLSLKERNIIMEELKTKSYIVSGILSVDVVKNDPDDNKFIEAALEGPAPYIISGDKDLLNIEEYEGIKIINAREFIKIILQKKIQ